VTDHQQQIDEHDASRRDFVRKAAYVTPAILTLPAAAAYAKNGSEKAGNWDDKWDNGEGQGKGQGQGQGQGKGKGQSSAALPQSVSTTPPPIV
jgi:hypothetical protein